MAACIDARDHPVIEERDEAVAEMALVLEDIVRKRLVRTSDWDPRYVSFDGLKTLSVDVQDKKRLYILGAFYLLDAHGHRMLPVEADLSLERGAASTVRVAGADGVFEMPQSERQFVRGVRRAAWRHSLDLRLA